MHEHLNEHYGNGENAWGYNPYTPHNNYYYNRYTGSSLPPIQTPPISTMEALGEAIGLIIFIIGVVIAGVGIIAYSLARILLAPLSSMIDISRNWGNLHHTRSKLSLYLQLCSLTLIGIGVGAFCKFAFNPFMVIGDGNFIAAIAMVGLTILISTALCRLYATFCWQDKMIQLLGESFNQRDFSDASTAQFFFGQDDGFIPGVPDYSPFFSKSYASSEENYNLFLKELHKLNNQSRLNIEQAAGRANFDLINRCSSGEAKYLYLSSLVQAMLRLDNANLLNDKTRAILQNFTQPDELIKIYLLERTNLIKMGLWNSRNEQAILQKLQSQQTDKIKLLKSAERRTETYSQVITLLAQQLPAAIIVDFIGEEATEAQINSDFLPLLSELTSKMEVDGASGDFQPRNGSWTRMLSVTD